MVIDQSDDALLAVRRISQGRDHLFVFIVIHEADWEELAVLVRRGCTRMIIKEGWHFQTSGESPGRLVEFAVKVVEDS